MSAPFLGVFAHDPVVTFTENRGQWPEQVLYRAIVPGGAVFVEDKGLTFVQFSGISLHDHGRQPGAVPSVPRGHAYRVHFVDGRARAHSGAKRRPHYENHYQGNDPSRWGTGCAVFGEVWLKGLWPGVDLRIDGTHGFKYDLVVAPGADPARAVLRYEGQEGLQLKGRELHVGLSTGVVVEEAPVAFGLGPMDEQRPVEVHYGLRGDELRFEMPQGHDMENVLVIDPVLTFSSYSGSLSDNFGFTATYDDDGHLYGGGIVFNAGYPISLGAFDPFYNGGVIDVGISKWTPTGNALVWSTYLGGGGSETPHSLVVNSDDELFVMGSTGSSNFPVTPGCFMPGFRSGPAISFSQGYGFGFANGTDIFVTHFNAAGTALIGSTYVGGSGTDGVNTSELAYNYGDTFRGEVALDAAGNPVVITSTTSGDIPITPGAPQGSYGGGSMDAYVFRMDPGLTTMLWATYHGGSGADAGHGVQFNSAGDVYITGGTNSTNMPVAGSPLQAANAGGTDGFIARYSANGTALLSSSYLGTQAYDQCFFVQLDTQDDVYVVGQTRGNYPVSQGVYANPGSSQFIHKLEGDLASTLWSTRVGNGSGTQDMSPSAFLVSNCGQIYFSGWAGATNNFGIPTNSNSHGMPITPDAFQPITDGSDFYLMVLDPDAAGLSYATYFGGTSAEHVDGGTSRFDKNGKVYQAVCAGCNGSFPTTPGAHATTNGHPNCNLGVFKFDLNIPIASIGIDGPDQICFPADVQFINNSTGGNMFLWDFGDGNTSDEFAPMHSYTGPGVFSVSMVMTDEYGCSQAAEATVEITSLPSPVAGIDPVPPLCPGDTLRLQASDASTWEWFPAQGLSSTTEQAPMAFPEESTTYFVVVTDGCGSDTTSVDVVIVEPDAGTPLAEVGICFGASATLSAFGGVSYAWDPPGGLSDPFIPDPVASPFDTTTYVVTIITVEGCEVLDTVTVNVAYDPPAPLLEDTTICRGTSVQLIGPVADDHAWVPVPGSSDLHIRSPVVSPATSTWFVVEASNPCGSVLDSAFVEVLVVTAQAWPDTLVCLGTEVRLGAAGGVGYMWYPPEGLDDPAVADPSVVVDSLVTYAVIVMDAAGCTDTTTITVGPLPSPGLSVEGAGSFDLGDRVLLTATASEPGGVLWTPPLWLECDSCPSTWTRPEDSITYLATFTSDNGCSVTDSVRLVFNGVLYVPNTFTPDGDGVNDLFGAYGAGLVSFRLWVFDRWGEEVFSSDDIERRWDGRYMGVMSQVGTYVWKVEATGLSGVRHRSVGHVNLIR